MLVASELKVKFIVLRCFLPSFSDRMSPLALVSVSCSAEDDLDDLDNVDDFDDLDNMMRDANSM